MDWVKIKNSLAIKAHEPKKLDDVNTCEELLGTLKTLRAAAIYDIFGQILMHELFKDIEKGKADPKSLKTVLPEGELTLSDFIDELNAMNDRALVETKRNANRAVTRNLLRESFRIVDAYCISTGQIDIFRYAPWYQFARVIVNSISHDFKWGFDKYALSAMPLKYREEQIDASLDGQSVSMQLEILINLVDDIILFVMKNLR